MHSFMMPLQSSQLLEVLVTGLTVSVYPLQIFLPHVFVQGAALVEYLLAPGAKERDLVDFTHVL